MVYNKDYNPGLNYPQAYLVFMQYSMLFKFMVMHELNIMNIGYCVISSMYFRFFSRI